MGRPKAVIEVEGVAMARRVADAVAAAGCDPVVAVGGDAAALASVGLATLPDRFPGEGPLGAVITALEHAAGAPVLVAACDLPWLDVATVSAILDASRVSSASDAVVASSGRLEPLLSWWSPTALEHLRQRFDAGERAVHATLAGLSVVTVPVAASALHNVNRPDDLPPGATR